MKSSNRLYIVMGVSGSGKSTVGKQLADQLGIAFHDGDDFHPAANVAKMQSGQSLNDADRAPWLQEINSFAMKKLVVTSIVIACSALKNHYRELISDGIPITFIYLKGSKALITDRLQQRKGHFMPTSLLDSQFETLEEPNDAVIVSIDQPISEIVKSILLQIQE